MTVALNLTVTNLGLKGKALSMDNAQRKRKKENFIHFQ